MMSLRTSFRQSNLDGSNFSGAELIQADFEGAKLRVNFENANLSRANLVDAIVENANFLNANISKVKFCDEGRCVWGLSEEQINSAWAYKNAWDQESLPENLKLKERDNWPSPQLCSDPKPGSLRKVLNPETNRPKGC